MIDTLIFVTKTVPTHSEIHCLVTHLTNKHNIPTRVERNGRLIAISCASKALAGRDIRLESNIFNYLRTDVKDDFNVGLHDWVKISTQMCYTINLTKPTVNRFGRLVKSINPLDHYGHIIKDTKFHYPDLKHMEIKTFFYEYLQKVTGLMMNAATDVEASKPFFENRKANPMQSDTEPHVRFEGVIDIVISARVADPAVFNQLSYMSIGSRRTYGFGSVFLLEHEAHVSCNEAEEEIFV